MNLRSSDLGRFLYYYNLIEHLLFAWSLARHFTFVREKGQVSYGSG